MKWLGKLTRWRSNHGYGVHSPFAFRFITAVVRQTSYAYYAYPRLDAVAGRKDRREARLLLRILCHLNPGNIIIAGKLPPWVSEAVTFADSRSRVFPLNDNGAVTDHPFFIIGTIDEKEAQVLAHVIGHHADSGMVAVVRNLKSNRGIADMIAGAVSHGMIFRGERMAIIVARPDLPHQEYRITL